MFCRECGNQISNNASFCPGCGVSAGKGSNFCPACASELSPGSEFCVKCGTKIVYATKSKLAAGLLGIFLGGWGIHRFYLGYINIGIIQIVATIFTCGLGGLWGFIEGILILCGNSITTDADGNPLGE
ncbi:MAG: TM2 domain-containing protein [Spirochaetes bacterium]|nr:TM2 domain-containing protein [Spirochaetota bacterium]